MSVRTILLVINAETRAARTGRPKREFDVLRERLDADVIDRDDVRRHWFGRHVAAYVGMPAALALLAAVRIRRYRAVHCDAESHGILLSLLIAWTPLRTRVSFVGHWPTTRRMVLALKYLRAHHGATAILVNTSEVLRKLVQSGVPSGKLHLIPIAVDTSFWSPSGATWQGPDYICSAGVEVRDYPTLVAAAGLVPEALVRIAASSPYSRHRNSLDGLALPANVERVDCSTEGLRDLYETCAFVVVPLNDSDSAAGLTSISEAMSMGKAVICSRARGQSDSISDRRALLRPSGAPTRGRVVELYTSAHDDPDLLGATGLYVPLNDPEALTSAIKYLLAHREVAEDLGRRGRRVAERVLSVEAFGDRVADVILREPRVRTST